MGAFTFGVASALVVFQCTLVLLQLEQSTWSFSLAIARPDASKWAPALAALLLGMPTAANLNNGSNYYANNTLRPANNNSNNNTNLTRNTTTTTNASLLLLSARRTDSTATTTNNNTAGDALTCLRGLVVNANTNNKNNDTKHEARVVSCILHAHTPSEVTAVLEPFNPHLILLSLACLQCLMAFGRMYRHKQEGDEKRGGRGNDAEPPYISLEGVGVVLTAILLAAAVVQGVHDAELVKYTTLLTLVLNWLLGVWYVYAPDGAGFHTAIVAAPLSVLCSMLFGPRLWPDVLQHYVLLLAAIQMGLLMRQQAEGRPIMRAIVFLLLFAPLSDALWNTGPFDAWRYVLILIGSVGLLPLLLSLLMPELALEVKAHHTLGGMELMANNAALLGVLVLLANL
jgi:hypothetical protein